MTAAAIFALLLTPAAASACSFWPAVGVAAAGQLADAASSRGRFELNPVLGRGSFGARQMTMKAAIFAGSTAGAWIVSRRDQRACRVATIAIVGAAGVTFGVSIRNWRVRQ